MSEGEREQEQPRVRLERLVVRRYRHVGGEARLEFGDGPILVTGRNGTGKTNLLRLCDAVTRLDFSGFAEDSAGLDISFVLRWDALTLSMDLAFDPRPLDGSARPHPRYRGTASATDGSASVAFEVGPDVIRGGHELERNERPPDPFDRFRSNLRSFLSSNQAQTEPWLMPLTESSVGWVDGRFDEALVSFYLATEPKGWSTLVLSQREDRLAWVMGRRMVPQEVAYKYLDRELRDRLNPVGEADVPWLAKAAQACGFDRLELVVGPPREEHRGDWVTRTYGPFTWFAERGASRFPHHDFSFGQKRIVALFWHLACVRESGGVFVADEIVNGLHHEALRLVLEQAGGMQAVLASQNPLLFDFMEYANAEDFRTRLVRCDPAEDAWAWRNPTEAEAARFIEAYDIGIEHVSTILRTEGLW